jgi:hypothetical protein
MYFRKSWKVGQSGQFVFRTGLSISYRSFTGEQSGSNVPEFIIQGAIVTNQKYLTLFTVEKFANLKIFGSKAF